MKKKKGYVRIMEAVKKSNQDPHKDCISKSEISILRQLIAETEMTREQIYERLLEIVPLPTLKKE